MAAATAGAYERDVARVTAALAARLDVDATRVTFADLVAPSALSRALDDFGAERGAASRTRARAGCRRLLDWAVATGLVSRDDHPLAQRPAEAATAAADRLTDPPDGTLEAHAAHWLAVCGFSANTRQAYHRDLCVLLEALAAVVPPRRQADTGHLPLEAVDVPAVHAAFAALAERYAGATRRRIRSTWSGLFRHLAQLGAWTRPDPTRDAPVGTSGRALPRLVHAPDGDPVVALIEAALDAGWHPGRNWWAARDAALVAVFAYTGARLGEVLGHKQFDPQRPRRPREVEPVRLRDYEHRDGLTYLRVVAKGGDEAALPLNAVTSGLLDAYLADRAERFGTPRDDDWLWLHADGGPLRRHHWETRMRSLYGATGLAPGRGAATHALRHTLADRMLAHGHEPNVVQRIMRHKNLATTSVYLTARDARVREATEADPSARTLRRRLGDS